ncbi:MAG: glycosyl transferase 2 family [Geobacteraceae bacterium]|nr:MAG: glycosyl transferase 2 family [Geobacteraceae bacterium]
MKILVIMVVYNQDISQSRTFQSLMGALAKHDCDDVMGFIIYDNSPTPQKINWSIPVSITYVHDPTNTGLAKAYNHALDAAVSNGFEWLLLLDQDTSLPDNFTANLIKTTEVISSDESVVAIVPRVECLGKTVSPSIIKFGGCFRPVDGRARGVCHRPVTSINSGTMLRTSFMQSVGGFNTLFWLDYLDHWIFSTIYSNSKRVFISESVVDHELSVMDYDRWMNLERYENILKTELLFLNVCRPKYEKYSYMIRLLKRMIVQLFERSKLRFFKSTFRTLKSILLGGQGQGILP